MVPDVFTEWLRQPTVKLNTVLRFANRIVDEKDIETILIMVAMAGNLVLLWLMVISQLYVSSGALVDVLQPMILQMTLLKRLNLWARNSIITCLICGITGTISGCP